MSYGIKNIENIPINEGVVICNNCEKYFYEEITDERNENSLTIIWDIESKSFFKGCPECQTDDFLSNFYIPDEIEWSIHPKNK